MTGCRVSAAGRCPRWATPGALLGSGPLPVPACLPPLVFGNRQAFFFFPSWRRTRVPEGEKDGTPHLLQGQVPMTASSPPFPLRSLSALQCLEKLPMTPRVGHLGLSLPELPWDARILLHSPARWGGCQQHPPAWGAPDSLPQPCRVKERPGHMLPVPWAFSAHLVVWAGLGWRSFPGKMMSGGVG